MMRLSAILIAALLVGPSVGQVNETGFGVNTLDLLMPPSAAPSESMAPTAPTASPTDSPVPSPSPSEAPTGSPTGTPMPTKTPTYSPTDSPVPSPSPTETPSDSPSSSPSKSPSAMPSASPSSRPSSMPSSSPSVLPSSAPSSSPSSQPSVSSSPSASPSVSPSSQPSNAPSTSPSNAPSISSAPSNAPSVSSAPSNAPSIAPSSAPSPESIKMSALVSVKLQHLLTGMTADKREVFESQTVEFIQQELPDTSEMGVLVDIMSVKVLEQSIISTGSKEKTNSTTRRRFLQEEGLRVRMNVTGEVSPGRPPDAFDFAEAVSMGFAKNYLVFAYRLASADPFFNALLGDAAVGRSSSPDEDGSGGNTNKGAVAGISVACIAALAIAVAAAFYALKARERSSSSFEKPSSLASIDNDFVGLDQVGSQDMSIRSPSSPNSLENGRALGITRKDSMASSLASSPASSVQSERILGIRAQAMSPTTPSNSNVEALLVPPTTKTQNTSKQDAENSFGPTTADDEASLDDKMKENAVMSYGPNGVLRSDSQINTRSQSIFDSISLGDGSGNLTEKAARQSGGPCCSAGLLGAQGCMEPAQTECMAGAVPPLVKRSGLYEVLAPPGPLGIVVDTTKDGPVIHSLKGTSTLLGLVGSGDLIVGLDDMDTRSMTAATLTRMMAKRSNQAERKITLLAVDN